ncbi:spore-associated protein A [Kitasatospora sp. NPDC051914]|uniref:spore-associated protein A n=1 Tax=Kitasatospora sp. NPDC051914 TaxID=3154945 RepID=UPI00344567C1
MKHGKVRRAAVGSAVLAAAAATVVTAPGPAYAAGYNGACGAGYRVIDSLPLDATEDGGTVYLTYNRTNGYNCVVTVRNTPGDPIWMSASIKPSGTEDYHSEQNLFTTYAGPVYLHAPGRCIDWDGSIGYAYNWQLNSHCG